MKHDRRIAIAIGAALLVSLWWMTRGDPALAGHWTRAEVLDAIRWVESSHRDEVPDGDDGKAIGPYQIHRVYWLDAIAFRPEIAGDYEDCRDRAYAERVVRAYMQRWVPDAWDRVDAEVIARVHNGGPTGMEKPATLKYWRRVRRALP